jgi:DcuC family C4-dicarboxylate transporter
MKLALGLLIIAATVIAILRRTDVRLVLVLAAAALGTVSGNLPAVVRTFLATLSREQFVVPICSAMGFAHVLRLTQCDRHLVHLLVGPIRRVRAFLIPGAVLVGFLVNVPVISQTSTAVAVGPVLVPLLRAGGLSNVTVGSALLLGASLGGELLNPGAPELRTVSSALGVPATDCVAQVAPLLLVQLAVATILFWVLSLRAEARLAPAQPANLSSQAESPHTQEQPQVPLRVNLLKALVPLVPLVLLFLTGGPYALLAVPHGWLVDTANPAEERLFDGRLIGAAMLIGVVAAALTSRGTLRDTARAFFEGAGYAFTHIISLIVTAACFGTGVELIGLDRVVGGVASVPSLLLPSAGGLPLAFAWLSGSGMAATQSLFRFFTEPATNLGMDPRRVGAVVSIGAAAGRTLSPVAAVTLMCASLTGTSPLELARRVALPLLAGVAVVVLVAWVLSVR